MSQVTKKKVVHTKLLDILFNIYKFVSFSNYNKNRHSLTDNLDSNNKNGPKFSLINDKFGSLISRHVL